MDRIRPTVAAASVAASKAGNDLRVCEPLAAYYEHVDCYYVKDGQPTGEAKNIKDATRPLQALYALQPFNDFGPAALAVVFHQFPAAALLRTPVRHREERVREPFAQTGPGGACKVDHHQHHPTGPRPSAGLARNEPGSTTNSSPSSSGRPGGRFQ